MNTKQGQNGFRSGRRPHSFRGLATFLVVVVAVAFFQARGTQAGVVSIGPGADLAGATSYDTPGGDRLNVALTPTGLYLKAGTYSVLDFQLNVIDASAGTGSAGTVTPMLLIGSPSSYTTAWVGDAYDPSSNGVQTAASYTAGAQTFTLTADSQVFAGIFTGNAGSAVTAYANGVGSTDHDGSFTAPTAAGETVTGFSNPSLGRSYAFQVNFGANIENLVNTGYAAVTNGSTAAVSNDLLQTSLSSVVSSGVSNAGPTGLEPVLRDGVATDTSGYDGAATTATRINNGAVLTYYFDTTASPFGYQIDEIDLFHGWRDAGRDRIIDFNVEYSTVDDPGTFITLLADIDSGNYASYYGKTSIEPWITDGYLATRVAALRFTFDSIENGYGGFSEIDVLGTAVPEPSTLAMLAGLAGVGLFGWFRRKRRS